MIFLGNIRSMKNFLEGTRNDIEKTYSDMVKEYEVVTKDNFSELWEKVQEVHMLMLQYTNVKSALEAGEKSCWTVDSYNEELTGAQRYCLNTVFHERRDPDTENLEI